MERTGQRTVYRSCAPVVDAWYETDGDESLSQTLVDALAEAEGVDATTLSCLYGTIDLDALARLFEREDGNGDPDALLSFTFDRWNVFVRADGRIRVCDGTHVTEPTPVFAD